MRQREWQDRSLSSSAPSRGRIARPVVERRDRAENASQKEHEEALLALMKAHAALGERSQALRAFRRFADRMRQELDAEPDDETTAFFERLQQGAAV